MMGMAMAKKTPTTAPDVGKTPKSPRAAKQRGFKQPAAETKAVAVKKPPMGELAVADTRRPFALGFEFITYNPDDLVGRRGLAIYDEMRRDDQIKACQLLKKCAIVGPGWKLEPANQNDSIQERLVETFTKDFEDIPGTFSSKLLEMLTCVDYGFSCTEKIWELGERVRLTNLKVRAPHNIDFAMDQYGNIEYFRQVFGVGPDELPPKKFILLSYRSEFSNPYGQSDLREAYQYWWYKKNWLQWWATFAEKLSDPPMLGTHPTNAGAAQVAKVLNILQRMQARTSLTLPEGWDVKLLETSRDPRMMFQAALDWFDAGIGRALLVPDKLGFTAGGTGSGGGSSHGAGSLAMSKTQMGTFYFVLEMIGTWVQDAIQDLVDEMTLYEVGDGVEPPKFKLLPLSEENKEALATLWTQAVQGQVVLSDLEDENHFRQLVGFPEKEQSERDQLEKDKQQKLLEQQKAMAALAPKPPQPPNGSPAPGSPKPGGPPKAPATTPPPAKMHEYHRPLTAAEERADLGEKARTLDALTTPLAHSLATAMESVVADLRAKAKTLKSVGDVARLRLSQHVLDDVESSLRRGMRASFARGAEQAKAEVARAQHQLSELRAAEMGAVEREAVERVWHIALGPGGVIATDQRLKAGEFQEDLHPRDGKGRWSTKDATSAGTVAGAMPHGQFRYDPQERPTRGFRDRPMDAQGNFTGVAGLAFTPTGKYPGVPPTAQQQRYWINHGYYTEGPDKGQPLPADTERKFSQGTAADGFPDYTADPSRLALHVQIMNAVNDAPSAPADRQPVAILTMGVPAAGKSTMPDNQGVNRSQVLWIDPDAIKGQLPEYRQAENQGMTANGLKVTAADAAGIVHAESSVLGKRMTYMGIAGRKDMVLDGTGADQSRMADMIHTLKASGYQVRVMMPDIPTPVAIDRSIARGEGSGRVVESDAITAFGQSIPKNFFPLAKMADEAYLYDGERPGHMIYSRTGGVDRVHDEPALRRFRLKAYAK